MRRALVLTLVLIAGAPLYPCSTVTIGGTKPVVTRAIAGRVIGFDLVNFWDAEKQQPLPLRTIPEAGATALVTERTDIRVLTEKDVAEYRKQLGKKAELMIGNVAEWKCGDEVYKDTADAQGNFNVPDLKPGKYCLKLLSAQVTQYPQTQYTVFLVNVAESAPQGKLLADIGPLQPDCKGYPYLKLEPAEPPAKSSAKPTAR